MEPETTTTRPPEEGEATQKILRMISDDAVAEGLQTSELVQKVRESITEISANRYVRALVGEEARARAPRATEPDPTPTDRRPPSPMQEAPEAGKAPGGVDWTAEGIGAEAGGSGRHRGCPDRNHGTLDDLEVPGR